jgi:hypothetical protein
MERTKRAAPAAFRGNERELGPAAKTLKEGGMKGQIILWLSVAEGR